MKKLLFILCLSATLSAELKVLALSGSTRRDSYNKKLVLEAARIAEERGAAVTVIDLKDYPMPFYDADLEQEKGIPENAQKIRKLMIESDAIIIASPEYNASVSAVLKNTLDHASRDGKGPSRAAFKGKKFAIMSASPTKSGGRRGLVHLQAIIEDAGGTVVPTQVSIGTAHEYFANENRAQNAKLVKEIDELFE